ncbi:galactose-1-phosphate uridylyltransferase, variant [Spizellomyces punctatus DAOM BR117]|uniref:Galactose-1-phosphate uridylyltransferase n=1 Tax=Spizellomyces punctatus (strain DAOM BR117) TaxID=645134 RepID=A0A0L0HAJ5_SPIPD|nr:galactose-1-phosphate uridylyltransferase, variant [Spizellomyces punctatus DAOM BR117]KNC98182.1 galactose-1-phosphate uridylyltransferase, variant [Spizellomyces punctatus DAOM BR117]|eukprot:XP_016606222.1 galactose-1-phosphate uridylyltransferase, variant [Spizellomyces punctatus DAOM BR117]
MVQPLERNWDRTAGAHDTSPSNSRAGGKEMNPSYTSTFVFPNDFPAVQETQPVYSWSIPATSTDNLQSVANTENMQSIAHSLLKAEIVRGQCRVVCFSPRHDLTMAEMDIDEILAVVKTWTREYIELSAKEYINYIQIFENKGSMMGCSNPHPHGQMWALGDIPQEPSRELSSMKKYYEEHSRCLLCDYVALETRDGARIVCENDSFVCLVPFWAVWPFETLVVSKHHLGSLVDLNPVQQKDLADVMRRVACRYDNVFESSFPYSMGIHGAPCDGQPHANDCHLHLHFYPPLLRSATIKKFLVGFEMMAEPQRDLTPEQAAERLRGCSEIHYKMTNTL